MDNNHEDRVGATTIGELDVHLGYLQRDIREFGERLREMATRDDIDALRAEMKELATRKELTALEDKVNGQSAKSIVHLITQWAAMIIMLAGAVAIIGGLYKLFFKLGFA